MTALLASTPTNSPKVGPLEIEHSVMMVGATIITAAMTPVVVINIHQCWWWS